MRDDYVGDIGDFGKYILLKELSAHDGIRLGINWYFNTRPEGALAYLSSSNKDDFRDLDRELFAQMKDIVHPYKRTVCQIEESGILQKTTLYYHDPIPYSTTSLTARQTERKEWFLDSLKSLAGANVVFLDPDNGIETPTASMGSPNAVKYSFIDEIKGYYDNNQSVVIYNHRNRSQLEEFAQKCRELKDIIGLNWKLTILKAPRFQVRYYIFIPRDAEHADYFSNICKGLSSYKGFLFECDPELEALINR